MEGCNFIREKTQGVQTPGTDTPDLTILGFAEVQSKVFNNRCISCHWGTSGAGGVSFETFSLVSSKISDIRSAVFEKGTMPPGARLSAEEEEILRAWIDSGAPEYPGTSNPEPDPEPDPEPEPTPSASPTPTPELRPTYASIKQNILKSKCLACHATEPGAADFPLEPYSALMESPYDLVVPGSPDASFFWSVVTSDLMPPESSGISPLTESELSVVEQWILEGAPEE